MLTIARDFQFEAAHRLPNTPPGHKCHGMHGHTWKVRVWIRGEYDPHLGWIIDYADINRIWSSEVYDVLDHSTLNDTVENPTTENLAFWIYTRIADRMRAEGMTATVHAVEISEGGHNWTRLDIEQAQPVLS